MTNQPKLMFNADPRQPGSGRISVRSLHADLVASLAGRPDKGRLLQSIFRVRVIGAEESGGEDLPDVLGRYEILENEVQFVPRFPLDSGIRFRAVFDPRQLDHPELSEVLTLEFSLPRSMKHPRTQVKHLFPSSDSLPENLLRFYVCFSNPMRRGRSEDQIRLLGPDGLPAPDTLYRAPIELWDKSMRHLTILLDPGRLKRGVGPNRELGPPLNAGQKYTLAIGSGMIDHFGRCLSESFYKSFQVTEAVREPIAVERWTILLPATKSRQPLVLRFPRPLDWAMLWHAISIASEGGKRIEGRIAIDHGEKRWRFTPSEPWIEGSYYVNIRSGLEDVSGNNLLAAFDRPLRTASHLVSQAANRSIPFHLA
ncbi:MAG: hypothetical protein JO025_08810 [Verrucomicrobia bacterium]|nr:hypothetical protein [Verrucomicrobiota bacterium]